MKIVNWMRKLLLVTALAVLPLQGFAMAAAQLVACHEQASSQQTTHAHSHDKQDTAAHHHDEQNSDGGTTSGLSGHFCGHSVVFHLPAIVIFATAPGFPEWATPALFDYTPHFPEQPRRPPRA